MTCCEALARGAGWDGDLERSDGRGVGPGCRIGDEERRCRTGGFSVFVATEDAFDPEEMLSLYDSVGWEGAAS